MKIVAASNFMKFDIKLNELFAGFSMASCKPGEHIWIVQKEFISSEDGDLLISRLEGFASLLLSRIAQTHKTIIVESTINNMLAILRKDRTATIYINAPMNALMQAKRSVEAGQALCRDDIADVRQLVFQNIEIPDGIGIMVLFSVGWRKGMFYDIVSLGEKDLKRDYDLNQLLGGYYAYLLFQERFKISDSEWTSLLQNGWFPFITLSNDIINNILSHNREGWNVDDLLDKIQANVLKRLPDGLKSWVKIKSFEPHMEFITKAVEHYRDNDFISCISVLFPRIEGIMRGFQAIQGQPKKAKQKDLVNTVLSPSVNPKDHKFSPLLPLRFSQYLKEVYFANFDPTQTDNTLSRHTVGHGVATKENFNLKGSTLGFLILDQLSYYFCGIS
ncbi:MAG: hypothetical protein JW947_04475 [Sedimentisphaerales bacterium]|nr:hypothetical protein [Sedimentisphaerales bacterium]